MAPSVPSQSPAPTASAMNKDDDGIAELLRNDRRLFSSLLKHIVQAAPNEDCSDFVLASIGKNVGADRCYVYWFWEPGKSSMCTNSHEWCAEGINPEIAGQQTCNLADLVEFNAHITSGRDFLFTDINAIDAGSRDWLRPQGIQSLIATPIIGAGGMVCGFAGFDFVKAPCAEFTDRIIFNIHEAADLLLNCQRLHERDMALLDVTRRESEREENERGVERAMITLQGDASTTRPKQMLEIVRNRLDADLCYMVKVTGPDGVGTISPEHALTRDGWTNTRSWTFSPELRHALDTRLLTSPVVTLHEGEIAWLKACMVRDESPSAFANGVTVVHSVGVRQEGRLVGVLCVGYLDARQLTPLEIVFLRRSALLIVSALERIATYHDLAVALNIAHLKGEVVEFMFRHQKYAEILEFVGGKVCEITGAQHLVLCTDDGSRTDWFGKDAPACCHGCAEKARRLGKLLPDNFFTDSETVIIPEGTQRPDMNLPPYCPVMSSAIGQFRKDKGWWRLVADYTKPHTHNMSEVARGLRVALELLAIAYDRERHEETIAKIQEHQRFRADMLSYALSKDDLSGLIDLTLHRLLELSACDYIAIHSIDGNHQLLFPKNNLEVCPKRCEACAFYNLKIPPVLNADNIIELNDAQGQRIAPLSPECPAKSLAVVVIFCEGKPWGGIALHYLDQQPEISEYDRSTLKIAANVLTLALERHSAAVRLQAERDRVIEAEKARSYFFSSVSHDIRTPLNAIIGFSELLQEGGVPPEDEKEYLEMIVTSGRTLLQLINDVLDLSKMDLGKLEFNLEPADIGGLVRDLLPMFQPQIEEKGQTIVVEIPELPPLLVDPRRFRQLLFNLIGNAVKYAGPCTIRVTAAYEGGLLKLTVADNGKGVSAEKAKRLMQPFVQADIRSQSEGYGLGLAICRRLVELANGTISISTAPGMGFSVHTEIPVSVPQEPDWFGEEGKEAPESAAATPCRPSLRVLVVDDVPENQKVLVGMLEKIGVRDIELAANGKEALDRLERGPSFDLVVADIWMPVMDGSELVKRIRADARFARLKVCAVTADVETRANYRDLGFDELLLKPVTIEKLSEILREIP